MGQNGLILIIFRIQREDNAADELRLQRERVLRRTTPYMQPYRRIRFSFGWAATFWIQGLKDLGVFKGIFRVQSSDPPFCYKSLIMHKNKPMPRSMENPPEIQDSPKCFGLRPSWETLRKREETSEEVVVCDVFLVRARLIWRIPHRCDRNKIYTAIFLCAVGMKACCPGVTFNGGCTKHEQIDRTET